MRKFILSLIALSIISLAFADTEITNKPANLQFPNMQRLIKCIKSFGKFTDEMAVEFKEMFALIANGEFYKAYLALKSLSEPAKQVYYDCKFLTETRRVRSQLDRPMYMQNIQVPKPSFKFPDINKIMQCIMTAINDIPELKIAFQTVIDLVKSKKYIEALIALKNLSGPALDIFNQCK